MHNIVNLNHFQLRESINLCLFKFARFYHVFVQTELPRSTYILIVWRYIDYAESEKDRL